MTCLPSASSVSGRIGAISLQSGPSLTHAQSGELGTRKDQTSYLKSENIYDSFFFFKIYFLKNTTARFLKIIFEGTRSQAHSLVP